MIDFKAMRKTEDLLSTIEELNGVLAKKMLEYDSLPINIDKKNQLLANLIEEFKKLLLKEQLVIGFENSSEIIFKYKSFTIELSITSGFQIIYSEQKCQNFNWIEVENEEVPYQWKSFGKYMDDDSKIELKSHETSESIILLESEIEKLKSDIEAYEMLIRNSHNNKYIYTVRNEKDSEEKERFKTVEEVVSFIIKK